MTASRKKTHRTLINSLLQKELCGWPDCLVPCHEILEQNNSNESEVNEELEEGDDGAAEEEACVSPQRACTEGRCVRLQLSVKRMS